MSIEPELRRHAIGASEIAAVMGWDPRRKPLQLWLEKMDLIPRPRSTYRMRRGKFLEKLLIEEEYPRLTGLEVPYSDQSVMDPERPYMVVTPDGHDPARRYGVEAKVVSRDQEYLWREGPPVHVYLQCAWSMAFFGYDRWDVIAGIADDEPQVWTVERDQELIDKILARAIEFYSRYLLPEEQPPIDGSAAAAVYLQRKFPQHKRPDVRPATAEQVAILEEYARVRITFKEAQARRRELESQLKEAVGKAEAEGVAWERGKFLWRKTRDGKWMDWESMAIALRTNFIKDEEERRKLTESYQRPKPGIRKIYWNYAGAEVADEDEEAA